MISIALATYNGERFLDKQLQSLARQTLPPAELVVCDDQSNDATVSILERFARAAPFPVRVVVNGARLDYRSNFLKSASLCRSEFIAFCDQDDIWLEHKLATCARHLEGSPTLLLQHGYRLIDDDGKAISGDLDYSALEAGAPWLSSLGLTQVFRRSLLAHSDLWELSVDHNRRAERMGHDQWIAFLASALGETLTVNDVLLLYRQHGANAFGYFFGDATKKDGLGRNLALFAGRWNDGGEAYGKKRAYLIEMIRRMGAGAASRATVIERLLARAPSDRQGSLRQSLAFYRRYADYQAARLTAYEPTTRRTRIGNLLGLEAKGVYAARGSRGIKDSFLDLVYGVAG